MLLILILYSVDFANTLFTFAPTPTLHKQSMTIYAAFLREWACRDLPSMTTNALIVESYLFLGSGEIWLRFRFIFMNLAATALSTDRRWAAQFSFYVSSSIILILPVSESLPWS